MSFQELFATEEREHEALRFYEKRLGRVYVG
jgi:hypothetical protein